MFKSKTFNTILLVVVFIGCLTLVISYSSKGWNDHKVIHSDFTNIDIDTKNATVHIVPTQATDASVSYTSRLTGMRKITLDTEVKGQTLNIELKDRGRFFLPFRLPFSKLTLTINLPEELYNELRVHNRNGTITANHIEAALINVRSNNGTIELHHVAAQIEARTNNGKITLNHVNGPIEARTNNGTLELITDDLDYNISMRANNGKILIVTSREPENAVIHARKNNGRISIFGNSSQMTTFGDGKHAINLRTNNGSIKVSK